MKRLLIVSPVLLLMLGAEPPARTAARAADVRIRQDASRKQYLVEIDGKPFTAYCYGPEFKDKPIFYPVMSPNGARVNREFPMVGGVTGESTDHPHHQSAFFAYDEVNGTNFWNPEATPRHIEPRSAHVDGDRLTAELTWRDKDGQALLEETKAVTFGGGSDVFWMDHAIALRASSVVVTMGDTKEGAFAIRLNDTLKEAGGSGRYLNAEGLETSAKIWGKTSAWAAIRGVVKDTDGEKPVTVAIFAHPSGLNAPPYWHARDYGLFAANPFARNGYDPKAPKRMTTVNPGDRLLLGYRLAVYAGQVDKRRLDADYTGYAATQLR